MQINTLNQYQQTSRIQQSTPIDTRPTTDDNKIPSVFTDKLTLSQSGQSKLDTGKEIMAKYDVRNMSHNSLAVMSDELRGAGLMSDQEFLMMNRPNNNLSSLPGAKTNMDEAVDIIASFEGQLQTKRQLGVDPKFLAEDEKRIDTLRFFESLQS
jgi:hypothetical protein